MLLCSDTGGLLSSRFSNDVLPTPEAPKVAKLLHLTVTKPSALAFSNICAKSERKEKDSEME